MRDLTEYVCRAMDMLDSIGVKYGNIIDCSVNMRAQRRWGQCRKVPGGYTININAVLLDERNSEDGLMNTILHELAHSVDGCMNHGVNWKAIANRIYSAYGYEIKRTDSAEDKGVVESTRQMKYKYQFRCEKCGKVIGRTRESKFTRNPEWFTHKGCGGHFLQVYKVNSNKH